MRVFIAVLVLIFGLKSWTKADDIRDFQIEGMSVGDSLLDYFSKEEIKSDEIEKTDSSKTNSDAIRAVSLIRSAAPPNS